MQFLAAGEWKAAMNMYRAINMWEEAYRVAKQNGGPRAAEQVAFLWANTLPIDSAIKLLNKYGILDACINYACETFQFNFAFQLSKNLPLKVILFFCIDYYLYEHLEMQFFELLCKVLIT